MTRRYFAGTALAAIESEMMRIPNFEQRRTGKRLAPRAWCSKEEISCTNCREHGKQGCRLRRCPYLLDRLEAGAVTVADLTSTCFESCQSMRFQARLNSYLAVKKSVCFVDRLHSMRFADAKRYIADRRQEPPALTAALYLLTADANLWLRAQDIVSDGRIDFSKLSMRSLGIDSYALVKEAKALCSCGCGVTLTELAMPDIIDDDMFGCIITAILLSRFGMAVLHGREENR